MTSNTLQVKELTRRFSKHAAAVVDRVSFHVEESEIFVLLGPSGCGKTTTLRMIAGLAEPDSGSIQMGEVVWVGGGPSVPVEERALGLVFQDYALFPHLSVLQNVEFGLRGLSGEERTARSRVLLELVQLSGYADRAVHELSGGEQQRVSLARAVARFPKLLLLDEPFGNLDASLRRALRSQLQRLFRDRGMSIILVTHEQEEALQLADRMGVMRDGRLLQVGTPRELYQRPSSRFVARFLGDVNFLEAMADGAVANASGLRVPLLSEAQGRVCVCLRPEDLSLSSQPQEESSLEGTVLEVEFRGATASLRVQTDAMMLEVLAHARRDWHPGERVFVSVANPVHHLPVEGD